MNMTSNQSAIAERVRGIVACHQGVAEVQIADDTSLFRNLDSLDIEELIMAFEDEFGCRIPDGDAAELHTVGDAIACLGQRSRRSSE